MDLKSHIRIATLSSKMLADVLAVNNDYLIIAREVVAALGRRLSSLDEEPMAVNACKAHEQIISAHRIATYLGSLSFRKKKLVGRLEGYSLEIEMKLDSAKASIQAAKVELAKWRNNETK